jgi:hypothetical protein
MGMFTFYNCILKIFNFVFDFTGVHCYKTALSLNRVSGLRVLNNVGMVNSSETLGVRLNAFYIMKCSWAFVGLPTILICLEYEMSTSGSGIEWLLPSGSAILGGSRYIRGESHLEEVGYWEQTLGDVFCPILPCPATSCPSWGFKKFTCYILPPPGYSVQLLKA